MKTFVKMYCSTNLQNVSGNTDRQTNRQTERQTDRQTDRQTVNSIYKVFGDSFPWKSLGKASHVNMVDGGFKFVRVD